MGLLVGLITVIVAIGGVLGYFKTRQLEEYIEQAREVQKKQRVIKRKPRKPQKRRDLSLKG